MIQSALLHTTGNPSAEVTLAVHVFVFSTCSTGQLLTPVQTLYQPVTSSGFLYFLTGFVVQLANTVIAVMHHRGFQAPINPCLLYTSNPHASLALL